MTLLKAKLVQIKWDENNQAQDDGGGKNDVPVQFNPATLRVTYTNSNKGGKQPGGSSTQYVGESSTKLAVELLFDTTETGDDVRAATEKLTFFINARKENQQNDSDSHRVPPGVSFRWGSFIFNGLVDSIDETLDYFSEEGVPLRATISLSISRQMAEFLSQATTAGGGGGAPEQVRIKPLQSVPKGKTLQAAAGQSGKSADWKSIAAANNIDDPLRLKAGALIDMNAGVSASASAGVSFNASASASASASAGASASASASASAGASLQTGAGASATFTAGGLRRR